MITNGLNSSYIMPFNNTLLVYQTHPKIGKAKKVIPESSGDKMN